MNVDKFYEKDKLLHYKAMIESDDPELIEIAKNALLDMARKGNLKACKLLLKLDKKEKNPH